MKDAEELIASGQTVVRRLTVPEGLTSAEIVALLAAAEPLAGDIAAVPPDGALLPETYHFHRGDSREGVLARMPQSMDEAPAELLQEGAQTLPRQSPAAAMILASTSPQGTGGASARQPVATGTSGEA